ncbi:N2,N2-dimethylguanosine tRNA methyltransferase-domain-containing protein [Peziza echinospora]|nr:N2,N2-dimethylguanosine tRNA methyltransferase-domain-containing protein [Peziza echinospora]
MLRPHAGLCPPLLLAHRSSRRLCTAVPTPHPALLPRHERTIAPYTVGRQLEALFPAMMDKSKPSGPAPAPRNKNNHTQSKPKPTNSQIITAVENGQERAYTAITEGKATILFPGGGEVFYNPIQNFNRDLSVLAIRCFGESWLGERSRRRKDHREGKAKCALGAGNIQVAASEELIAGEAEADKAVEVSSEGTAATAPPPTTATKVVQQTQPNFRILDALSATGLRALRYSQEIPFATSLVANDLSASAVASIRRNINHNAASNPSAIAKIKVETANAMTHMYLNLHHYHVIDLDPYGTAAPFLDAALQSIVTKDSGPGSAGGGGGGGLLCVTCTDAGVWASTGYAEKCYALYGGQPLKGECSHEAGLRLILYSIASTAAKYGLAIEPLLSLSIDFYARVFVRVKASPATVKHFANNSMIVYNCDSGCGSSTSISLGRAEEQQRRDNGRGTTRTDTLWKFKQPQAPAFSGDCEHCGFRMHIAGPMWAGPLHDETFLNNLLKTVDQAEEEEPQGVYTTLPRVRGMVSTALDECTFVKRSEAAREEAAAAAAALLKSDEVPAPTADVAEPTTTTTTTTQSTSEPKLEDSETTTTAAAAEETSAVTPPPTIPRSTPPYPRLQNPHFFIIPTRLSKTIHSVAPPQAQLRGALVYLGYSVGRSHCKPNSIKTDAPFVVIWEIMRQWVARYAPVKAGSLPRSGPGWRVLYGEVPGGAPPQADVGPAEGEDGEEEVDSAEVGQGWKEVSEVVGEVVFDAALGAVEGRDRRSRSAGGGEGKVVVRKEVRYQQNPTANWGPMKAAKGSSLATPTPEGVSVSVSPGAGVKRKEVEISEKRVEGEGGVEMEMEMEVDMDANGKEEKKIKLA